MRLTLRDGVATLAVAAATFIYFSWLAGAVAGGRSTRVVAAVVFALGWVACTSAGPQMAAVFGSGREARSHAAYRLVASLVGGAAFASGILALITRSTLALTVLLATTVVLWGLATVRHALSTGDRSGRPRHSGPGSTDVRLTRPTQSLRK